MKKQLWKTILFVITISFYTLNTNAQDIQHMDFKGIPIDGSMDSYVNELNQKGFTTTKITDEAAMLKGQFAGEDVELAVYTTPKSKTVYMVVVAFPEQSSWYSMKSDFKKLENNIQEKYGKPSIQRKTFTKPYYEGDGYEMTAVKVDKCKYYTRYLTDTGEITLLILNSKQIALYYVDKTNDALGEKEKNQSVYEDL